MTTTQHLPVETFRGMLFAFLSAKSDTTDDKRNFRELQQSINDFSKLKESWPTVLRLLMQQTDKQIMHFASNILKDKMKYDYAQLSPDVIVQLHQTLIEVLKRNPRAETGTLFNLSYCVCYLYMQQADKIGDLLQYLVMSLGNHGLINYIFTVLLIIPEEVDNYKVVIEERKRNYVLEQLKSSHVKVLAELNRSGSEQWQQKIVKKRTLLECFKNWVELKYSEEVMSSLPDHFMLNIAITFLKDIELAKDCQQTLIEVIKQMKKSSYNDRLFKFLLEKIIPLFDDIDKMIEEQQEEGIEHIINVVCRLGRYAAPLFANIPDQISINFQNKMLKLTRVAGIDNMESIVKYWRKFLMNLHRQIYVDKNIGNGTIFRLLLEELYLLLGHIGQYSLGECQELNQKSIKQMEDRYQQFEDKQKYRNSIPQLYDMIGEIVSYERCVELSLEQLAKLNTGSRNFWQQFEVVVLPLIDIVDDLRTYPPILTETIGKLCQLQPPFICVQEAIICVLSRASKLYRNNREVTQVIFTFLVGKLSDNRLKYEAAKAFQNVCDNNTDFVVENIASFMQVLRNFKQNEMILHGIALAVATRDQFINLYLPELCRPYIEQIQKKESVESVRVSLKRLNQTIVKATRDGRNGCEVIISEVFKVVWPVIKPIIENPQLLKDKDEKGEPVNNLIERCCKFIKVCMRCLKLHFLPYISEVFASVFSAYQNNPIASYVYIVEIVVTVFSEYKQFTDPLKNIYQRACQITFNHLSKLEMVESKPQLAEDFFGMNMRFMRYAPKIVLRCDKLDSILEICQSAIGVENKNIANALYGFIESLYMVMWPIPFIELFNKTRTEGEEFKIVLHAQLKEDYIKLKQKMLNHIILLNQMINHLNNVPSESVRDAIKDGLEASIKAFPEHNVEIWKSILMGIGEDIFTPEDKNNFLMHLSQLSIDNLQEIREYLHLMSKRFIHRRMRAPLQ